MDWELVIGLEIHAQLATRSKIFSGAPVAYGAEPNTQACPIDLGLPGVLPVLNREVVRMAVMFGLAIEATVAERSVFARKNYFYPDLPKGYQISQYDYPIVRGGRLLIDLDDGSSKAVGVTRAHLEEDAGKSLHANFHGMTGIDLNRAGTPLLEIVSEPQLRSAREAVAYMKKMHTLVRYLGICDGNMQEGSFRCDANVSVRPRGHAALGTRTEIKNVNSFRFVERAIEFEAERQIDLLEDGGQVVQETRLYDPERGETRSMRAKEEANDYRYFPDPDLQPLVVDQMLLAEARKAMPELPDAKRERFMDQYALGAYDASVLVADQAVADFFERTLLEAARLLETPGMALAKATANWVMGDLAAHLKREGLEIAEAPVTSQALAEMLRRVHDGTISGKLAKDVFEAMWAGEGSADQVIERKGLRQITDVDALETVVDQVIAASPEQVAGYRAGRHKLMSFFVGQVMKATQGKANPKQVNELLKKKLDRPEAR